MQSTVINACLFYERIISKHAHAGLAYADSKYCMSKQIKGISACAQCPLQGVSVSCTSVFTHTEGMLATALRLVGLRIILSRVLTMSVKRGLTLRSFCQQSSMSWCRVLGQSIGGGRR